MGATCHAHTANSLAWRRGEGEGEGEGEGSIKTALAGSPSIIIQIVIGNSRFGARAAVIVRPRMRTTQKRLRGMRIRVTAKAIRA